MTNLVMRLSIIFPGERPSPPTESCESPAGEANTGLIGPDISGIHREGLDLD